MSLSARCIIIVNNAESIVVGELASRNTQPLLSAAVIAITVAANCGRHD